MNGDVTAVDTMISMISGGHGVGNGEMVVGDKHFHQRAHRKNGTFQIFYIYIYITFINSLLLLCRILSVDRHTYIHIYSLYAIFYIY